LSKGPRTRSRSSRGAQLGRTGSEREGLCEEAIVAYETAIRLRPHYHKAYNNLGGLLHAQGRFAEALAAYTSATALVGDYAEAQCNKGMLHLLLGEFEAGWRGYEHGLDMKRTRAHVPFRQFEMWKGEATSGKTIAVWDEQGIGDQIMFASCYPTSWNVEPTAC
jgi:tetratricopeptide (TPR) repeat protein